MWEGLYYFFGNLQHKPNYYPLLFPGICTHRDMIFKYSTVILLLIISQLGSANVVFEGIEQCDNGLIPNKKYKAM